MQLRGTDLVLDKVRAKKNVISGQGATRTLNENEKGIVQGTGTVATAFATS